MYEYIKIVFQIYSSCLLTVYIYVCYITQKASDPATINYLLLASEFNKSRFCSILSLLVNGKFITASAEFKYGRFYQGS